MVDFLRQILAGQLQAGLTMLNDCIEKCPDEHWDGIVGKYPFWLVAYHTLCYVDLYLSPSKEVFEFCDIHPQGWKEFDNEYPSRRFDRREILEYTAHCRAKAVESIASETQASLAGPSGFSWCSFSRGEMHIYNIRHLQHHAGQLGAFLRRIGPAFQTNAALPWVRSGQQ